MHEIFIIEDDVRIAQLQQNFIDQMTGFNVIGIAHSLSEASEQLPILRPQLIILDLHLPDGSGLSLLSQLHKLSPQSDVIVITAAKEISSLQQAMRGGVFDYILKPMTATRFKEALNHYQDFMSAQQTSKQGSQAIDQDFVDSLIARQPSKKGQRQHLPKGIDEHTLSAIRAFLPHQANTPFNAKELAENMGLSRSTARRYLEFLVSLDEVITDQVYGQIGRPERKYIYKRTI